MTTNSITIMTIRQLHYVSGISLALFTGLHLSNHLASLFGAEFHIQFMEAIRPIYRNIVVESLLMLAILLQVFSGLKLVLQKRKAAGDFYSKLQIRSGLYLAFFLLAHSSAVLLGRYVLGLDTNFYFGAAALNSFPYLLFFVPSYLLAILSVFGHLAAVHRLKMKASILGFSPTQQSNIIIGMSLVLSLLIFYGMTNQFQGVDLPTEYQLPKLG